MSKRTGLGRGLGAFFGSDYDGLQTAENGVKEGNPENGRGSEPIENETEKVSLEELDMVLPGSKRTQKRESDKGKRGKTQTKSQVKAGNSSSVPSKKSLEKTEPVVKIVEIEKEKFVNISLVEPRVDQPRKVFDEEQLHELAESIANYGVLQPLIVKEKGDMFEIIAGERRWRAAKLAGIREVPVIVRDYTKQQTMEIALIENVQREDLNPIEEAKAYQMLIQEFGLKQEEVAERVSKNRATITNSMRLLKLDERVQEMLIQNRITGGHARALLPLEDGEVQYQIALKIEKGKLSVRETERLVKALTKPPKKKEETPEENSMEIFYRDLEEKLKERMGTKVIINKKDKNKGRIEIEYYSSAELERLVEMLQSIGD